MTYLTGLTQSLIITQLNGISVKTALPHTRKITLSGEISGVIDGKPHTANNIEFPGGYLIGIQVTPRSLPYPLYVSTSGSVLQYGPRENRDRNHWLYSDEGYRVFVDNSLVLHNDKFEPISSLAGKGELRAVKDLESGESPIVVLGGEYRDCYEARLSFDGDMEFRGGLSADIMGLDGLFKLKPRKGMLEREPGRSNRLRGDWEAVLNGHVDAEVGSVSIYSKKIGFLAFDFEEYDLFDVLKWFPSKEHYTPSSVRVFAEGDLVV